MSRVKLLKTIVSGSKQPAITECAVVLCLCAVGLVIRLHNVTSYILYPDGYQNLLVAQNLAHAHGLLGSLGPHGMQYPNSLALTRPLYPALVALIHMLLHVSYIAAGHRVSLVASVLAIPLGYYAARVATDRQLPAVVAASLMAASFTAIVWSGYTMTESVGNAVMLLTLLMLFTAYRQETVQRKTAVMLGLLLGLCFLARYEYLLLLIPAVFLLAKNTKRRELALIIAIPCLVVLLCTTICLGSSGLYTVARSFGPLFAVTFGGIVLIGLSRHSAIEHWLGQISPRVFVPVSCASILLLMLLSFFGVVSYGALYTFEAHDFLTACLAVVGFWILLKATDTARLGVALLMGVLLLGLAYAQFDNAMWRYFVHLLPLLIVPAAIGGERLYRSLGKFRPLFQLPLTVLILTATIGQLLVSYAGLHRWDGGIWFQPGYEQASALALRPYVTDDDRIVTAIPEPYYFFTETSTVQARVSTPFIPLPAAPNVKLVIVQDAYLQALYPDFSNLIDDRLGAYKIGSYQVPGVLRFGNNIARKPAGVVIYRLTTKQYSQLLQSAPVQAQ